MLTGRKQTKKTGPDLTINDLILLLSLMNRHLITEDSVNRPVPRVDQGSLIGWGGGGARHRRSVDLEGSGGIPDSFFFYKFD